MTSEPHEHDGHASWSSFELAGFLAGLSDPPRTAIDVGCGTGGDAVFLAGLGITTTGVDVSGEALDRARERAVAGGADVTWIEASALDLPIADASIDLMTDRGCLHHLDARDRPRYASEAARVLRPGGTLLVRDMSRAGHASHQISADALGAMIAGLPLRIRSIVPFRQGTVTGIVAVIRRDQVVADPFVSARLEAGRGPR
jgi:ubiquinone/menaquinone biosynthesis C-methylase UbiE